MNRKMSTKKRSEHSVATGIIVVKYGLKAVLIYLKMEHFIISDILTFHEEIK